MATHLTPTEELQLFSSESVTAGHPDKFCDQVSDAILDAVLAEDPSARVAIETMATQRVVHVGGELTTTAYVDVPAIVNEVAEEVGYGGELGVITSIGRQSPEISAGVSDSLEWRTANTTPTDRFDQLGAGDQGIMFGYATDETSSFMPAPIFLAHRLTKALTDLRRIYPDGDLLGPDGKAQVTVGYNEHREPVTLENVVVSSQHAPTADLGDVREFIRTQVIEPVLESTPFQHVTLDTENTDFFVNPGGLFTIGGPLADAGLTGRKIIVDTYGGRARHGGGAFSGKDPSKVDRSAAYALRWVAKNVVAAGLADEIELQVAYAIGSARPKGLYMETFGTEAVDPASILKAVREVVDLRPAAIIERLGLLKPIYGVTAAGGHFGRSGEADEFPWERLDLVSDLLAVVEP